MTTKKDANKAAMAHFSDIEEKLRNDPEDVAAAKLVGPAFVEALITNRDISAGSDNFGDAIADAASRKQGLSPYLAAMLIRFLGVRNAIDTSQNSTPRHLVEIIEKSLPDLAAHLRLSEKRQTFEKLDAIKGVHQRVEETLEPFLALEPDLDAIISSRKMLTRALSDDLVKTYVNSFRLAETRASFETVYSKLIKISKEPVGLATDIEDGIRYLEKQLVIANEASDFLAKNYYHHFISISLEALSRFFDGVRGKFKAVLSPRLSADDSVQKRYPLHEERRISLALPFRNSGPGTATEVQVKIEADAERVLFESDNLLLGSVPPGDFSAVFEAEIVGSNQKLELLVTLTWQEVGEPETRKVDFVAVINSQRAGVNWAGLEYERPYSTAVARGGSFVGRTEKVQGLANKILRNPVESFYVTGQKRVGKTSLVLAAVEFAKDRSPSHEVFSLELLWGSFAFADPTSALKELGEEIASFISATLPASTKIPEMNFDGSIASIVRLGRVALEACPTNKYVIIIDEFDEIHPELYQSGNLAETFFANIRAITNLDNICLILIGGENMPFVMDRQGQKLNKLVRFPLDYFSRDREWEDFKLLVRRPTEDSLEWHDEAVSTVFNVTNGNPFFAKIVCGAVFENSVRERDSDITSHEVEAAINAQVPSFDTNSFSHLWQDGIYKPVGDREPEVLRRCRTLVLVARTLRRGQPVTLENLVAQKQGISLADNDVVAVMNDFVRRGVVREIGRTYEFVLPIFGQWLAEVGGSRLIADALGEELAFQVQTAEDQAYVKSDEISALVRQWPTFRGQAISGEDVRAWLEQVEGHQSQRLLFTLLKSLRVLNEGEVREKLRTLHGMIRQSLPEFIQRKRADRRKDVVVTYLDGEGKSGQYYASRYAEENRLAVSSIVSPASFDLDVRGMIEKGVQPSHIVVIDDLIGTGRSLTRNLESFVQVNEGILRELNTPVVVFALASTVEGDEHVRKAMQRHDWLNFDLRFCDALGPNDEAFPPKELGFWTNEDEKGRAKALCLDIGATIYRDNPLGFGQRGFLLVFPNNCPNNSLPILHSFARPDAARPWRPLFPRAVH